MPRPICHCKPWYRFQKNERPRLVATSMGRISERCSYFLLKRFHSQQLHLSPLRSATHPSVVVEKAVGVPPQVIHERHSLDSSPLCQARAPIQYHKNRNRRRTGFQVYCIHFMSSRYKPFQIDVLLGIDIHIHHDKYFIKVSPCNYVSQISGPTIPQHHVHPSREICASRQDIYIYRKTCLRSPPTCPKLLSNMAISPHKHADTSLRTRSSPSH